MTRAKPFVTRTQIPERVVQTGFGSHGDNLDDLEDVCPETTNNDCLNNGENPAWKQPDREMTKVFNSNTFGRPGGTDDLHDFLLTYDNSRTLVSNNEIFFCASNDLLEEFELSSNRQ